MIEYKLHQVNYYLDMQLSEGLEILELHNNIMDKQLKLMLREKIKMLQKIKNRK